MLDLSDEELRRLLADTENNFVERKTVKGNAKWLHTAVAFANSTPIGAPAVLFVGLNDDGTFERVEANYNWEKLQKTVTQELIRAYPPLPFTYKIVRDDFGAECLAVIVWGSPDRPHFAAKSYVRVGPETKAASEEQFNLLIAERSSKTYKIRERLGRQISVATFNQGGLKSGGRVTLLECNQHYFTVQSPNSGEKKSYPLSRTEISFDNASKCLRLEFRDLP